MKMKSMKVYTNRMSSHGLKIKDRIFLVIVFGPKEIPLIKQVFDAFTNVEILPQNSSVRV